MTELRLFIVSAKNMLNDGLTRCNFATSNKKYSVFPSYYIKPIFRKDAQEALFQSKEKKKVIHEQIKPAMVTDTCSEFYDARILKFTNILMKKGDKKLANQLVAQTFENIKRIQLERYHKAIEEEKENIELDPFMIFHHAVDNCTPILQLIPCKKGGITYQVPVPTTDLRAQHTSMKWLIQAANEKEREQKFTITLAKEFVAASQNQGRAVQWKQELHKKCQANRAYAHFRWL